MFAPIAAVEAALRQNSASLRNGRRDYSNPVADPLENEVRVLQAVRAN